MLASPISTAPPWLRQLELRDRRLIKHFRQDEDDIYRLVRIEDLDGHAISFLRDADGCWNGPRAPTGWRSPLRMTNAAAAPASR